MNTFSKASKKRLRVATSKGGKNAAAKLTPKQRSERARNAVAARIAKRKPPK